MKKLIGTFLPTKTNADRIRAMSDEELLRFLLNAEWCDVCDGGCDKCSYGGNCEKGLADWLRQPAKEVQCDG